MKKKVIFCSLASALAISLCAGAVLFAKKNVSNVFKANAEQTITVGSDEFGASDLDPDNYQELVTQDLPGKDAPTLNYYLAKKDSSDNLVLAPLGRVYNYNGDATYLGRITNLISITVKYSGGALFIQEGIGGKADTYGAKHALTSEGEFNFETQPNHFMISNSRAATTIESLSFTYVCSTEAGYTVDRLGTEYTGMGSDSNVYTLTRDGSNISFNGTYNGTIAVDGSGNFTINLPSISSTYSGKVSADFRTLEFTGKTGAVPALIEMNRVYVVEDFENYTDRGTGHIADKQASMVTASDLRGDYYVDAGSGTGATWVSGSGFKLPNTANYLNVCTSLAHSGSKSMLLQGQKAGWVRLWNRDVWNQNQHFNFGRGNRLAFWMHSARNNNDGSGVNASNVKIRAQVYYQNFVLTDSNRNSTTYGTGTSAVNDLVIATDSGWNKVVIPLDPSKVVMGLNIMINNSGISTDYVFMPIDDITVYTEPVYEPKKTYEQTSTAFTKSYHGTVRINTGLEEVDFAMKVAVGANGYVYAYCGKNMDPIDYSVVGDQITIRTSGDYSGLTFGDWVGTLSNDRSTLTIQKSDISGTIKSQVVTNTIVLTEDTVLAEDLDNTTLQTIFKRQHNSSGTWADSDNSGHDTITKRTDYYMSGSSSLRLKPWGDGHVRMIVDPTVAEAQGIEIESLAFWYYVPAGVAYNITIYAYSAYTPKLSGAVKNEDYVCPGAKEHAADDSGWHYINVGFPAGFRKNFGIFVEKNSSQTIIDYVTYF